MSKIKRQETHEEKKALSDMMSFIDRVVEEIEEAGIDEEHAVDSETDARRSARVISSGLRTKRQHTA